MAISRRDFVRHAGLATLFSPFISLLQPGRARAQAVGRAKYLLIFHTTGTNIPRWTPTGSTEDELRFSEMTTTLEPLRKDVVIVENLNSMGSADNHGSGGGLTGRAYDSDQISLDQFVAEELRAQNVSSPIPVLNLGGNPGESPSTFRKGNTAITPIFEPVAAFDAIFNGVSAPPGGGGGPSPAALIARKKSILDLVRGELGELSSALGPEERQRLALHQESIRNLERRLDGQLEEMKRPMQPGACTAPSGVTNDMTAILKTALNLEMAVTAMGCGLTRVAAVEFGHHQSFQVDLADPTVRGDWHNGLLHGEGGNGQLIALEQWLCKQFVAAAEKMRTLPAPDGAGTLFDQTLMVWTRGMGDSLGHSGNDMRFVLSGGAGGYLKKGGNGRYIRANGEPHQTLLTACAEAMGVTDFARFGNPQYTRDPFRPLST